MNVRTTQESALLGGEFVDVNILIDPRSVRLRQLLFDNCAELWHEPFVKIAPILGTLEIRIHPRKRRRHGEPSATILPGQARITLSILPRVNHARRYPNPGPRA